MLGSESNFFSSDKETLDYIKGEMVHFLKLHKTKTSVIDLYVEAYEFFIEHPKKFDGATVLKDVEIIPNLDIWAMIHDYMYIKFNVAVSWRLKYYADIIYTLEMERMGISYSTTWVRFVLLLLISHLLFTPYELIKGKRITKQQRIDFNKIIKIFGVNNKNNKNK